MNANRTANANLAPRCRHTKLNGQPCAAPARRNRKYCVFHESAHAKRPDYAVRLVEDAMSLQLALFQVMRSLDDHALDTKRAALKLYALQIAASNLKRLHEETESFAQEFGPDREQSLAEMFLQALQSPEEEQEEEMAESPAPGQTSIVNHPSRIGADCPAENRIDIHACTEAPLTSRPKPKSQSLPSRARMRQTTSTPLGQERARPRRPARFSIPQFGSSAVPQFIGLLK